MKKLFIVAVLSFCSVFANRAFALAEFGWERPILKSEMSTTQARPEFSGVQAVQLIMTKQDGRSAPTGFVLLIDDQVIDFAITDVLKADCSSRIFNADALQADGQFKINSIKQLSLALVDHSTRECRDGKSNRWEATLYHKGDALISAAGEVEPVFTIQ